MPLKILIIGGSGNLGLKICNFFLKKKYSLINIDKKKVKSSKKISFINLDLNKNISKDKLPINIDIVIYSAGYIGGVESLKNNNINKYFKLNLYSLSNLLENIDISKLKKIIFFSSEQVYGDNQINFDKKKKIFFEPRPKNYYGASKLIAEKYLYYFYCSNKKKFNVDILRIPRVIDYSKDNLIYKLLNYCSLKKKINISNINERFNFIFISDFLNLINQSLKQKKKIYRILDLGSKDYRSFNIFEIVKKIDKVLKTKTDISFSNRSTHNPVNLKINYDYSNKSLNLNSQVCITKMIKLIKNKYGFK